MQVGDQFNPYRMFTGIFIPNVILSYEKISLGAKVCYGRLCQYAGENGYAYPSHQTLADELGVSRRMAQRYLKELEQDGLIKVIHRKNNNTYTSNVYQFTWHKIFEDDLKGGDIPDNIPYDTFDTTPVDKSDTTLVTDMSTKENHLNESNEENQNTVENHDCDFKETTQHISNAINEYMNEFAPEICCVGHLSKESKKKASLDNKFSQKNIPKLLEPWEKGRKTKLTNKGGTKVKDPPKNANTIISYFRETFQVNFGSVAPLEIQKDRSLAKKMIEHYGYDYTLEMFEWVFDNWAVFVREKKIKGVPTVGLVFGFRAYIQSKIGSDFQSDNESEW